MSRFVTAVVAVVLMVGGLGAPARGVEAHVAKRCVTERQFDKFPLTAFKQSKAERLLGNPWRRGNPPGSDSEDYSVQYKVCGKRWNKAGFYIYYDRDTRRMSFAAWITAPGGTIDTFPHAPAGPSLPVAPASK